MVITLKANGILFLNTNEKKEKKIEYTGDNIQTGLKK